MTLHAALASFGSLAHGTPALRASSAQVLVFFLGEGNSRRLSLFVHVVDRATVKWDKEPLDHGFFFGGIHFVISQNPVFRDLISLSRVL